MPDITMCQNNTCPQRTECYRWTAKPSEFLQSYATFKPNAKGECVHKMHIGGKL
jgi:hypothetical protein